jgi:hypothetical protein
MARRNRNQLAGLAALAGLGMLMARKKAGVDTPIKASSVSETKESAKEAEEDPEEAANKRVERMLVPNQRGDAGTSETTFAPSKPATKPATAKPAATTKPSAATGLKNPGTGNQRGPTAEELTAYRQKQYADAQAAAATPEGKAARQKQAESQGLEGVYPEQMIGGPGLKTAHSIAKGLANRFGGTEAKAASPYLKELPYNSAKQLPNAPTKQITGPSKGELVARDRAARAAGRNEEMLRENARRYGLDPDNISAAEASKLRQSLGGSDFSLGMKRGGKVKGYANGGSVGTASKRADGIASRGKTKCKMY